MALKNDDAGGSDSEHEDSADESEEGHVKAEISRQRKSSAQKQPTGRIVGIIKRNWRP